MAKTLFWGMIVTAITAGLLALVMLIKDPVLSVWGVMGTMFAMLIMGHFVPLPPHDDCPPNPNDFGIPGDFERKKNG
jgi:hypothetical protein